MKTSEFRNWIEALNVLSSGQRDTLREQLQGHQPGDQGVRLIEQSLTAKPSCPYCASAKPYRWGISCDLQRYRCRSCQHTFNALTHTPLARLRSKQKWLAYEQAMVDGLSIRRAAVVCGIAKNTSFKWRHRFLSAPLTQQPAQMSGIVEANETYFPESFKGQRHLSRVARKRGEKAGRCGLSAEKIAVLLVRDRHGETADFVLPDDSAGQVEVVLSPLLNQDILLCTDTTAVFQLTAQHAGVAHLPGNLVAGEQPIGGIAHLHNVNAYETRLKLWMVRFHGVATRYLASYLGWHRMLDRQGAHATPIACFIAAIGRERRFQQTMAT